MIKMDKSNPEISVVIPTRNRGCLVVDALESVFRNTHPSFEVILVDQSTNMETAEAIRPFLLKPNFRYIPMHTQGAGRARNIGLFQASGAYVAYTDDDCTVPQDWLATIVKIFTRNPSIAVLFCSVLPAPHDSSTGTIPHHIYTESSLIRSLPAYLGEIGMAAGMAVRPELVKRLGGFDENLGPGSLFKSAEDYDLALRALVEKFEVYQTGDVGVIHYGYRTYDEFRELTKRDWFAIGAAQAKILKCFHWDILPLIIYNIVVKGFLHPISNVFKLKKPQGFKRVIYFFQGFLQGLKTPVDPQRILYKPVLYGTPVERP